MNPFKVSLPSPSVCFVAAGLILLCWASVVPVPVDGFVGVAVEGWGRGRLIRTVDAGASWAPLVECYIDLHAVALPSPYSVVAVGVNGSIIVAATNASVPSSFTSSSHLNPSDASYASTYPGSYLSLISQYSALAVTANSSSPNSSLSAYDSSLYPPPSTTAWTPTSLTYIYSTLTPPTTATLTSLIFLNPLLGLTVGTSGAIYRTLDGGRSFTGLSSALSLDLSSLSFIPTPLAPTSPYLVLACGNVGALLRSTDAGSSWSLTNSTTPHNLYAVAIHSPSLALACGGQGTLLSSTNGGATWTDLSLPLYANVSFTSIAFQDAATVFLSGSHRTLVRSADGGRSFTAVPLPASDYLERLSHLFFTPTVLVLAGRSQLYSAAAAHPTVWTSGPLLNINSISAVAVMEAGVLTPSPSMFNLSTFCDTDVAFNFSVSNTGTDTLHIAGVSSDDPLVQLQLDVPVASFFPLTLTPSSAPLLLSFSYLASALPSLTYTYYTSLTLLTDTPQQQTTVYLSVYTLPLPSVSSSSFLSQYWYVIALVASAVSVLAFVFVRRRMKYIAKWNRRVLYEDEKIHFWGCWLLSKEMEHDSDSDFWSEEEEEGEEEGEEGGEGEDDGDWVVDEDEDGPRPGSKEEGEEKDGTRAGKRRRAAKRRSTSSQAGDGGGDEEWDEGDDIDPDDELADDDDTDSSISDQGHTPHPRISAGSLMSAPLHLRLCAH